MGHFKESGEHYSGFTYPELMALHHNGQVSEDPNEPSFPARPVLSILTFRYKRLNHPIIKNIIKNFSKQELSSNAISQFLSSLGQFLVKEEKRIFGSSALAANNVPPKDKNSPLVDTGDLRDKTSYRTSRDNSLKSE